MLYKEIINTELKQLIIDQFPVTFITMGSVNYGGEILVVFVEFEDVNNLAKNWKDFNSFISTKAFSIEKSDFSKWNLYIFYLSKEADKGLKYEIGNNKFSSRKIVVEDYPNELDNDFVTDIIKTYITNEDILKVVKGDEDTGITRNPIIENALNKFEFPLKKSDQAEYSKSVLKQIEKTLKDEI